MPSAYGHEMGKFQVMPMPIPSYHPHHHHHHYHAAGNSTSYSADNTISPYPTPPPQPAQFVSHAVESAVLGDGSSSSPSQHTSSSYSKVCPDPSLPLLDTSIYAFPQQQEQDSGYYQAMQEYYVEWYQRYGYSYPPDPSCVHPMPMPMPTSMPSNHADSRHVPHSFPSYAITPITPQYHFADGRNVSTPPVYGDDRRSMGAGHETYASRGKPSSAHRNGKGWWTDPPGGEFFQQDFKSQEYGALGAVQQGSTRRSKQRSRSEVSALWVRSVQGLGD
jgi:hypothetical protein